MRKRKHEQVSTAKKRAERAVRRSRTRRINEPHSDDDGEAALGLTVVVRVRFI
jgi:hypothetical protein